MSDFTWIPIYSEIANKILEYENRQPELITLLKKLKDSELPVISIDDQDENGTTIPLNEIDPFTFFANFNRGITDQNRKDILQQLKVNWQLVSDIPGGFSGIPVVNNMQSWFFGYKCNRNAQDIPLLWKIFKEALNSSVTAETFNSAIGINRVKYNLTMGLYWINPNEYLNLDSVNRTYLDDKYGILINDLYFETYKNLMKIVRDKTDQKFFEISYEAWKNKDVKKTRYWIVNSYDKALLKQCIINNRWMMQYQYNNQDKKMVTTNWRQAARVKEGDLILLYCFENKYYAWGKACKPKCVPDQIDNVADVIKSKSHNFSTGIIFFEDAECFYENLSDLPDGFNESWGQRIDVKKWENIADDGVCVYGASAVKNGNPHAAISEIDEKFLNAVREKLMNVNNDNGTPKPPISPENNNQIYTIEQCSEETGFSQSRIQQWVQAIDRKKQAVFFGPPGTGKTFMAERFAKHLMSGGDGVSDLIQFHPAYTYEEFMQGIRPVTVNGNLSYELKPGRLKTFCERAATCTGISVLIIDEINRANLSKVFGELMYLLEYRDEMISLAGGEKFSIPDNVRIIGTMNTADRSIALVDFALRRRFTFLELAPEYEILKKYQMKNGFDATGLTTILQEINTKINDKNFALGISFFMKNDLNQDLESIWKMEIETYLEEYFFSQPGAIDNFRWDYIKSRILL